MNARSFDGCCNQWLGNGCTCPCHRAPDPLRPPETDQQPDLTDIATHASGVWLTALVAVAAAFFVVAYLWSRSA